MSLGFLTDQLDKLYEHIFYRTQLDTPIESNGLTLRSEFQNLADMSNGEIYDERLDHEPFPKMFAKSSRLYSDLSKTRNDIQHITFQEIISYTTLKKIELTDLELKAINTIDDAYVAGMTLLREEVQNRKTQ